MIADVFIDTNIIVYAFDQQGGEKHKIAKSLLADFWQNKKWPWISIQVLQETYVNIVRKGADDNKAMSIVLNYLKWNVIDNNALLLQLGLHEKQRWGLSLWDCMILAAARTAGVARILSEDLSDTQDYDGIRVENPFKSAMANN